MHVEVVYALSGSVDRVVLELAAGATVGDAIRASGLCERRPEIDLGRDGAGVFGKLANLDAPLAEGDRVEIYRPLIVDPKELRRRRVVKPRRVVRPRA